MIINVSKEDLFNMILRLQERLDLLEGRPRGPISMTEARLACERKDKATMRLYLEQFEKGGDGKDSVLCGVSSGNQVT